MTEVDETRQPCTLILIGHANSGKSTIAHQIMRLIDEADVGKF